MEKKPDDSSFWALKKNKIIFFKMKLLSVLIFTGSMAFSASTYSQKTKIDLQFENSSLTEILNSIEKKSEFIFIYNAKVVDTEVKRSISAKEESIEKVLSSLFDGTDVTWRIDDRQVFLYKKSGLQKPELIEQKNEVAQPQKISLSGVVKHSKGGTLPGVSVVVKGITIGTITDIDGRFTLQIPADAKFLLFSFIGMKTQEVTIGGKRIFDIALDEETVGVEEVVVVGYGVQKKASVVAAISTVSSKDIVRTSASNLTIGLASKLPGLTIMVKDGQLGAENLQTLIRGQATMNSSAPLILVDGVERSITSIDANDIESVSILKDASATAVYGVRGANGVIIVTSKKGLVGEPQVTANMSYSLQTPTFLQHPLGAIDYMILRNQVVAQDNPNNPVPYPQSVFDHYKANDLPYYYVDRNWYKEFMNKYTPMTNTNVNIRGGNETTKYFVSAGYMHQGGPFKTSTNNAFGYDPAERLNRFNYRANIEMQINKSLKGWINLSGSLQDKNDPIIKGDVAASASTGNMYTDLLSAFDDIPSISAPDLDPYGNVMGYKPNQSIYGNLNQTGYRITTRNQLNNTIGFEQNLKYLTPGLSARAVVSFDANATHIRGYRRTYMATVASLVKTTAGKDSTVFTQAAGTIDSQLIPVLTQSLRNNFDLEASLNYIKTFGKHSVTGLLLYKQSQEVIDEQLPFNYLGVVGRVTYNYAGKYLSEVNFGYNGSEQFAPGRRFGFFPSFSAGWVISEENFMKPVKAIQFLKIRGSFGQVGNDQISNKRFIYLDDWTQGNGGYSAGLPYIPGLPAPVYQNSIPNTMVTWEKANKANLGLESKFLNGFGLDLDVFYEKRSSILLTTSIIPNYMFGQLSLPPTNDGVMENKGFETSFSYKKQVNHDFYFETTFSASFAQNKVLKANETPFDSTFVHPYRTEGYSRGTMWGYKYLGYYKDLADIENSPGEASLGGVPLPGDLKYADLNHDGIIDEKDKIPMDNPSVPKLNMALSFTTAYKGFDFSILFQYVTDYTLNYSGRGVYDWEGNPYGADGLRNYFQIHEYAWTADKAANGGDIRYPRLHVDGFTVSKEPSDYWMINFSYLRVKNIELGYKFPEKWCSAINIKNIRIYVNALNALTLSNMPFKTMDPEVSNTINHPVFANYNLGVNVTF